MRDKRINLNFIVWFNIKIIFFSPCFFFLNFLSFPLISFYFFKSNMAAGPFLETNLGCITRLLEYVEAKQPRELAIQSCQNSIRSFPIPTKQSVFFSNQTENKINVEQKTELTEIHLLTNFDQTHVPLLA